MTLRQRTAIELADGMAGMYVEEGWRCVWAMCVWAMCVWVMCVGDVCCVCD